MKAPAFWLRSPPTPLARALRPLGAIYGAQTLRRMALGGARVAAPVICVGNFVLGGAGKTPTAMAIGKLLLSAGERVAFISRGYGGARRSEPIGVDLSIHSARLVGDEPLLLAGVAPCFVGDNRVAAAQAAIDAGANVIIMDDGLQNPHIRKDFSLGVIDAGAGFGNGLCFPAGPLRAPAEAQLRFVSAILLIGPADAAAPIAGKTLLRADLRPQAASAAALLGQRVFAFAGIARPEKFYATLRALGAHLVATRDFADHHPFSPRETDQLLADAAAMGAKLVTTQKDWVRLSPQFQREAMALPVELRFEDEAAMRALLAQALARRRAGR